MIKVTVKLVLASLSSWLVDLRFLPMSLGLSSMPYMYVGRERERGKRREGERGREGERDCKLSKRAVRKQEALKSTRESKMKSICRRASGDM